MEILIILITTTIVVLYVIHNLKRQSKENQLIESKIQKAKNEYFKAKSEVERTKRELLETISTVYGKTYAQRVNDNIIWVGMSSDLVIAIYGYCKEIQQSVIRGKLIERWYFHPYTNRLNNIKYKFEITLENNHITGWKDLP